MIHIEINNEGLYKTAKKLGHHFDAEETIENALKIYINHLQQQQRSLLDNKINKKNQEKRTFGQHKGLINMSDDFDEPLPSSFWFGDDR